MKSLAILSNKGGVGKTSIAVNIAFYLAKQGKRVFLLEHDFQGPSLMNYFPPTVNWINNYFYGKESLCKCIQEIDPEYYNLQGSLFVAYANPSHDSIKSLLIVDTKKSLVMLQNLLKLTMKLKSEIYRIEYFIIDCSPGVSLLSVNPILIADECLFIMKISNADLYGTREMIYGIYDKLKHKSLILMNQVPEKFAHNLNKMEDLDSLIQGYFLPHDKALPIKLLGFIPADIDLLATEFEDTVSGISNSSFVRKIFIHDYPDHEFSQTLINLIPKIFGE